MQRKYLYPEETCLYKQYKKFGVEFARLKKNTLRQRPLISCPPVLDRYNVVLCSFNPHWCCKSFCSQSNVTYSSLRHKYHVIVPFLSNAGTNIASQIDLWISSGIFTLSSFTWYVSRFQLAGPLFIRANISTSHSLSLHSIGPDDCLNNGLVRGPPVGRSGKVIREALGRWFGYGQSAWQIRIDELSGNYPWHRHIQWLT